MEGRAYAGQPPLMKKVAHTPRSPCDLNHRLWQRTPAIMQAQETGMRPCVSCAPRSVLSELGKRNRCSEFMRLEICARPEPRLAAEDVAPGVIGWKPSRELKGFEKVRLNPGETKHVAISLDARAFSRVPQVPVSGPRNEYRAAAQESIARRRVPGAGCPRSLCRDLGMNPE